MQSASHLHGAWAVASCMLQYNKYSGLTQIQSYLLKKNKTTKKSKLQPWYSYLLGGEGGGRRKKEKLEDKQIA